MDRLQASAIDVAPHAHPRLSQAAEVECDEVAKKRDEMLKGIGNLVPDSVPCSDDEGKNTPACRVWLRPLVCACDAHLHMHKQARCSPPLPLYLKQIKMPSSAHSAWRRFSTVWCLPSSKRSKRYR